MRRFFTCILLHFFFSTFASLAVFLIFVLLVVVLSLWWQCNFPLANPSHTLTLIISLANRILNSQSLVLVCFLSKCTFSFAFLAHAMQMFVHAFSSSSSFALKSQTLFSLSTLLRFYICLTFAFILRFLYASCSVGSLTSSSFEPILSNVKLSGRRREYKRVRMEHTETYTLTFILAELGFWNVSVCECTRQTNSKKKRTNERKRRTKAL